MALPALATDQLHVLVFGPGTGELVAVRAPPDDWLIVDGCGVGRTKYGPALLERYSASPRLIALTHPHRDHAVGVADVVDAFTQGPAHGWPKVGLLWPTPRDRVSMRDLQAYFAGGHPYRTAPAPRTFEPDSSRVPYDGQTRMRLAISSGLAHARIVIDPAARELLAIECGDGPRPRIRLAGRELALTWRRQFGDWLREQLDHASDPRSACAAAAWRCVRGGEWCHERAIAAPHGIPSALGGARRAPPGRQPGAQHRSECSSRPEAHDASAPDALPDMIIEQRA